MDRDQTIRLAVETLMESVESGKNIEVSVTTPGNKHELLDEGTVERIVKEIEKKREEEAAAKQGGAK